MNKKYSHGSNLVIIIIMVVILILLGVVGYLFWQNQTSKKSTSNLSTTNTSQTTTEEQKVNEVLGTTVTKNIDEGFGVNLSFSVPEDWAVSSNKDGVWPINADKGSSSETIAISAPDNNIVVIYHLVANGGMGGVCMAEEMPTYKISYVQKQDVPNFNTAVFLENISKDGDKLSSWKSGLYNKSKVENVAVGNHACDLAFADVINLSADKNVDLYTAYILVKDRQLTDEKGNPINTNLTQNDIEQVFKNENYIKAKNILLSTKIN